MTWRSGHGSFATPKALPFGLSLYNSRRGMSATLVASNHRLATLKVDSNWPLMSTGQRLTLDGRHGELGPVQFHLQVVHDRLNDSNEGCRFVQARWVLVTAMEKRSYLVQVLRDIMGLDARLVTLSACTDDVLGEHRKLLFEVDRQRVRLINTGESVLPKAGEAVEASTPSVHAPNAPRTKRTQPGIVISTV